MVKFTLLPARILPLLDATEAGDVNTLDVSETKINPTAKNDAIIKLKNC